MASSEGDTDANWDRLLAEHNHAWKGSLPYTPYTALDNNCYAYATKFLNRIRYDGSATHTKESLVTDHGVGDAVQAVELYLAARPRASAAAGTAAAAAALTAAAGPSSGGGAGGGGGGEGK